MGKGRAVDVESVKHQEHWGRAQDQEVNVMRKIPPWLHAGLHPETFLALVLINSLRLGTTFISIQHTVSSTGGTAR